MSPLLPNVLLDEVDKELEKRGHAFVRYADECNVYVQLRARERVMKLLQPPYSHFQLRINESKSAMDLTWDRELLGHSFCVATGRTIKRRISAKTLASQVVRQGPSGITRAP